MTKTYSPPLNSFAFHHADEREIATIQHLCGDRLEKADERLLVFMMSRAVHRLCLPFGVDLSKEKTPDTKQLADAISDLTIPSAVELISAIADTYLPKSLNWDDNG